MKPIRYGLWKHLADTYHGWRDGRGKIPGKPPQGVGAGPVTTPHREALIRQAQDAFAYEHLEYRKIVADPHRRIAVGLARRDEARSSLKLAESAFATEAGSLTDAAARTPRFGEEHQPPEVIIRRRRREHQKRLGPAWAAVTSAQYSQGQIEKDLALAVQEARQQHRAAAVRVQRIHEYIHRRLAVYRRALVRSHPHGSWVNSVLSVRAPEIPGWALPDYYWPDGTQEAPDFLVPEVTVDPQPPAPKDPAGRIIDLKQPVTRFGTDPGRDPQPGVAYEIVTAPVAAPWHFTIVKDAGRLELQTRSFGHGPFIGGKEVGTAILRPGDYFDFADHRYTLLDGDRLEDVPRVFNLIAADLGATTRTKVRLSGMSFVQRENSLLAVLGPSGAGKSSMFSALLGELPLDPGGRLYFRELSMATHSRQIRELLGFVPQDIELHETLTVEATLRYGFGLRSAGGKAERAKAIDHAIKVNELEDQRHQVLGTLSGGQKRRVSIALELLVDPPLLLLDEPTSGLDAGMDRQIMSFLREHAAKGHTVIVVTHATGHLSLANQILVVVENGAPAFSGPPGQIRRYFGFWAHADLMKMLSKDAKNWAEKYHNGEVASEAMREADELERRLADETAVAARPANTTRGRTGRARRRQYGVLLRRQCVLLLNRLPRKTTGELKWLHNLWSSFVAALPLLVAGCSALLAAQVVAAPGLGAKPSPAGATSLMLLTTLCMLTGQALAYSDVVNELPVIRREFRAGVGALPALSTKWLVYAVVAVGQAGLITVVSDLFRDKAPQRSVLVGPQMGLFISLAALSVGAMSLGLLLSTLAAKLEQAVALVTATSIAQIALNGITSNLSVSSPIAFVADLLPDRWGLAAAASSVDFRGINLGHPTQTSPDALWDHTSGQWLDDLAALAVLSAVFFALAVWRLNVKLRPRRRHRRQGGRRRAGVLRPAGNGGRGLADAVDQPGARPGQERGCRQVERELIPLERPVAGRGLIGDDLVEGGGDPGDAVLHGVHHPLRHRAMTVPAPERGRRLRRRLAGCRCRGRTGSAGSRSGRRPCR